MGAAFPRFMFTLKRTDYFVFAGRPSSKIKRKRRDKYAIVMKGQAIEEKRECARAPLACAQRTPGRGLALVVLTGVIITAGTDGRAAPNGESLARLGF